MGLLKDIKELVGINTGDEDDERDETFISSLLLRLLIELLPLCKESVRMVTNHLWFTLQLLRECLQNCNNKRVFFLAPDSVRACKTCCALKSTLPYKDLNVRDWTIRHKTLKAWPSRSMLRYFSLNNCNLCVREGGVI